MTAAEWVPVDDDWKVGVDRDCYAKYRTGAEPWIGELSARASFVPAELAGREDWRDAARLSIAAMWQACGFRLGEAPRIGEGPVPMPDGRVAVYVTGLVTIPPYWTGPPETLGQATLWEAL